MIRKSFTAFLLLLSVNVRVQGQACQEQCQDNCNTTGLTQGGPEGRIVNIAYGKPASLSSFLDDTHGLSGPGCMAVNGRTSTTYMTPSEGNANCVHTDHGDFAASWFVDLGRQYTIDSITIFRRSGNFISRRMAGLSVLVESETTNQTCYSFPNSSDNTALDALPEQINITCDPPLTGQRVWLRKHGQDGDGAYYFINVCEVQVWGCKVKLYGPSCNMNCNAMCGGDGSCYRMSGVCVHGCVPGYFFNTKSSVCDDCPDGSYGDMCNTPCGNCKGGGAACDKVNGTCTGGCQSGFDPAYSNCTIRCSGKTFGENCGSQCGLCQGDGACDTVTGHCSTCQTNKLIAPLCQVCVAKWHGSSCDMPCSALCGGDGSCDKNSGTCVQDCVAGYFLNGSSLCGNCPDGSYGDRCNTTCGNCTGGAACDKVHGACPSGCQPGFDSSNLHCTLPCSGKTYGQDCVGQCGMCKNDSEACDLVTGYCSACKTNLLAPLCQEKLAVSGSGPDISVVAGGSGAGIVVLLMIAVVIVIVIRRKRRSRKEEEEARPPPLGAAGHADAGRMPPANPLTFDSTESDGKRKSQKPLVAVKPTVQQKPAVNMNNDSGNIYQNVGPSIEPSELGDNQASSPPSNLLRDPASNPPETSRRQVSAASYLGPEELEDESPLAEGGRVYSNEGDADVYASFKASEPRLDSVQKYLVDRLASGGLVAEFLGIKKIPDGVVQQVGVLPTNSKKNRFRLILPYDRNRVVLQDGYTEDLANDFVNASYITGYYSSKQFIAAQGPRPNTMGDFWRMVWEEKTGHVVMLTNILENGKTKCELYWPEEEGETQTYGPVTVTTTDIQCRDDFFVRTFRIKRDGTNESRDVTQYHFTAWPDHGVPTTTSVVTFYRYVSGRTASSGERATAPPVVVHCSAGVGRTGTYIGLDIGIDRAVKDGNIDVLDLVTSLREERCLMVQAVEQYTFLHKALLEAYTAHGTNVSVDIFEELFPQQITSGSPHPRLDKEFQTLQQSLTLQPEQRHDVASLEENITKNRDITLLPSDSHLAYLEEYVAGRNQFINAVFMPTFRDSRGCVVTQLPLPNTLVDFWRLVYGSDITTVVSLSAPNEEKEVKPYCQYWPTENGGSVKSGPYDVTLSSKIQLPGSEVTTYSLILAKKDAAGTKSLQLLHYKGWTGEVGGSSSDILHLIDTLVTSQLSTSTNRIVVQCSDGVRKSGLFCTLVDVINRMTYDREVDVYMTIRHVQSITPKAITSAVQYRYCYEVVQRRVREMVSIYGNAPDR